MWNSDGSGPQQTTMFRCQGMNYIYIYMYSFICISVSSKISTLKVKIFKELVYQKLDLEALCIIIKAETIYSDLKRSLPGFPMWNISNLYQTLSREFIIMVPLLEWLRKLFLLQHLWNQSSCHPEITGITTRQLVAPVIFIYLHRI